MGGQDVFRLVGTRLDGKYEIEAVVGEGGFGVVYRARHVGLDRPVAVKCLKVPPNLPRAAREEMLLSFRQEAQMLRDLSTETVGVVQCLDVGALGREGDGWTPYLVLEWMSGEELADWLAKRLAAGHGPPSLNEAMALLEGAASGLSAAHVRHTAHRDVKPANVFVVSTPGGLRTKILDFGIAKVLSSSGGMTAALQETGQRTSAFTPLYGAPEQFIKGRYGATGTWTDVYAFALVVTELVTGTRPYDADSFEQCMALATHAERPTPARAGCSLGASVDAVLERALALQARDRYPTLGDFWSALRAAAPSSVGSVAQTAGRAAARPAVQPSGLQTALPIGTFSPGGARAQTHEPGAAPSPVVSGGTSLGVVETFGASARTDGNPGNDPGAKSSAASTPMIALAAVGAVVVLGGAVFFGKSLWEGGAQERKERQEFAAPASSASSSVPASSDPGMAAVPAGTFMMGAVGPGATADEAPLRKQPVAAFLLDRTEVPVRLYQRCVSEGKCSAAATGQYCNGDLVGRENHPINCINHAQATAFCKFAGKRLPTEVEWEWVALGAGTTGGNSPWGAGAPPRTTCWDRADGTCEVGKAREDVVLGIMDLHGNVREWTADFFGSYAPGSPTTSRRAVRGASWRSKDIVEIRASARAKFEPDYQGDAVGVRCAKDP